MQLAVRARSRRPDDWGGGSHGGRIMWGDYIVVKDHARVDHGADNTAAAHGIGGGAIRLSVSG